MSDHTYRSITGLPTQKRSEITPSLFLGGQYSENGYRVLSERGITGIINMRERTLSLKKTNQAITILHLPTKDLHAPSLINLQKGIQFISDELKKGGKVYVHCFLGEGRGPTMVIAYLMSTGMHYEEAYKTVKHVRPFIRITKHQQQRLQELERLFYPELTPLQSGK